MTERAEVSSGPSQKMNTDEIISESNLSSTADPDTFDDWNEETTLASGLKSFGKLLIILFSYGLSFWTIIQFGIWMADISYYSDPVFYEAYTATSFLDWVTDIYVNGRWMDPSIIKVLSNIGLFVLFTLQHSLLSSRYLKDHMMGVWHTMRYEYQIDKPLYTATTGLALQVLMRFWQRIPVHLWKYDFLLEYNLFVWIHISAWTVLYGTCLMLDLPAMIGLNHVIIQSPTITAKSPELQQMYQRQRHMGLVPFIFILLVYPYGSLDRLILAVGVVYYTYCQWKSETCYDYAKTMKGLKTYRLSY